METKCEDCKYWNIPEKCYDLNCSVHNHRAFAIEDKPMEQKKYRLKKDYKLTSNIFVVRGKIFYTTNDGSYLIIESFDVKFNIPIQVVEFNPEWFEEVKEDTLESIIDNNFIGDEIKKNLKQCIVKQKIELLKEVLEFIPISYSDFINNKISELQKEIK